MRSNRNIFVACGFLFAVLLAGCAKREIKNLDSSGTNVICFGDSITFGYGVSPGEDYPTALSKMLECSVINAGIDGDTTTEALKRIETDVLDRSPHLVIIEFGGNDFLRGIPKEKTISNIQEMMIRVHNSGAMVAIMDISAGLFLNDYRSALSKMCQEEGAVFIPKILSGIITNPSLKSDFIHPNAEGYRIIAERACRGILPYLNKEVCGLKKNR